MSLPPDAAVTTSALPSLGRRASGVLLHPTSLPGRFGAGDLGPEAWHFVDRLAESGQSWWQMLPVGPAGPGDSPYSSPSAFAGNPLLVSLEGLADEGLLDGGDLGAVAVEAESPDRADFAGAARSRMAKLRVAHAAFERRWGSDRRRFDVFRAENEAWLEDWALWTALARAHAGSPWPAELRARRPDALERARRELEEDVRFERFVQFVFDVQWRALRAHARTKGIGLIGDVPIYVAPGGADVWSHPDLFLLRPDGEPEAVAGVPPDYFSETGQLWGNPLYRWDVLKSRRHDWWLARLRSGFARFDALRLDHFIGFVRYWEVPAGAKTAAGGRWRPGPGADFFVRLREALGPVALVAEDLGAVTPEVTALRDAFDLPGMRVLQFAFGAGADAETHRPHNYVRRAVVYTGTHDNDTAAGWFHGGGGAGGGGAAEGGASSAGDEESIRRERETALAYLGSDGREVHWDLVRLAWMSVADTAIVPMQDLLGLGSEARMNVPATAKGNWAWRMRPGSFTVEIAARLRLLTETYGRQAR